jgi:uncharacterized membrane protein
MKYITEVEIDLPRDRVIELFDDLDNYANWQESLVSMERIDGEAGQVGATTRLDHKMGKREVSMVETVTRRELPGRYTATYEAKGVWNEADNHFEALQDDRTRWTMNTEFRCSGIMWLMTTLMPGMFKKQTQATMEAFKTFAEAATEPPAEETG